MRVVSLAISRLKELGRVPQSFSLAPRLGPPMVLYRHVHALIGKDRHDAVKQIKTSLEQHGAAVVWGGPGEGKSCVGLEAACQLWEAEKCLGGALDLNLAGEAHS